ncbi:exoribonculease Dhp1 [Phlyctochytrium arcticum]|nr:exoribonculease Dhp1 [Phlyctochytrium arcticum]KAI9090269.1 exoribonculease Dhp1 [Phlyctochytrium arcticum]
MGVPAFFRWLSQKYPKVTSQVAEELPRDINGITIPVDSSKPNPNGAEFDNLYLDMNGIIHPCCHPEGKPAPSTEEDMFIEIFKYIDRIMTMIRPRKVLYMAIDGVAPRAKMNQQRSRRFRAAQEAQILEQDVEKVRKEWEAAGDKLPEKEKSQKFDSNCITPGTPFMSNLAVALRYYVADRLSSDPGWRNLKVILSDASVPGEGEHKIMDYIRRQRGQTGYDADTHHVLYGLDADLIMLALSTHEPHFQILREDVFFSDNKNKNACFICGQPGHQANQCQGKPKEKTGPVEIKPFIFLHIGVLREYLEVELKCLDIPFTWSLERAIDDWVFLCFFVGNDFLPHLPSLEIREGAIDRLIELWRKNLTRWGGYLTDSGDIDLKRVEEMMEELGKVEDDIFKERRDIEDRKRLARERRDRERDKRNGVVTQPVRQEMDAPPEIWKATTGSDSARAVDLERDVARERHPKKPVIPTAEQNKAAALSLKKSLVTSNAPIAEKPHAEKRPHEAIENDDDDEEILESGTTLPFVPADVKDVLAAEIPIADDAEDEVEETLIVADVPIPHIKPVKKEGVDEEPYDDVRLWEPGWKSRYYRNKFGVDESDRAFRRQVVTSYVEGLCWVLKYYYQGCQSWKWYFPYHYAPFASDFDFVGELDIQFELGTPFRPFEQLMGVLPAYSRQHIPPAFRLLMTESESPIIDFYPEKFPIDLNGKKFSWQGVALLPFIEEERLLNALDTVYSNLTEEEVRRNTQGEDYLIVGGSNALFENLCAVYGRQTEQEAIPIDFKLAGRFFGSILPDPQACLPGSTFHSPLVAQGLPDISNNHSISVRYYMPIFPTGHIFKAELLDHVTFPATVLDANDAYAVRMGLSSRGGRGGGRGRGGRGRGGQGPADRMIRHGISGQGYANEYQQPKRPRYNDRGGGSNDALPYMGGGGEGYNSSHHQSYPQGYNPGGFSSYQGSGSGYQSQGYQSSGGYQSGNSGGGYNRNQGGYHQSAAGYSSYGASSRGGNTYPQQPEDGTSTNDRQGQGYQNQYYSHSGGGQGGSSRRGRGNNDNFRPY